MIRPAFCIGMIISLAAASPVSAQSDPGTISFEAMKETVGVWRTADTTDSPLRVRFSLTAGGTVLVEEWTRSGQPHSLTLYHRDGVELIATHYCPQGNQPRLTMLPQLDEDLLQFSFKDATDLDPTQESHVVALSFDLSDKATLVRRETYREDGVDEASELRLIPDF